MVVEVAAVGLVGKKDLYMEEMKVDSVGIVGKKMIVGKVVDRIANMFGFHEHILANFEHDGFGFTEETKSAKA